MSNTVGRGRGPMGRRRGMSGEKAKDFKDAMLRLLKYMERYKLPTDFDGDFCNRRNRI